MSSVDEVLVSPSRNGSRKRNLPNLSSMLFQWRVSNSGYQPMEARILVPLSRLSRIVSGDLG